MELGSSDRDRLCRSARSRTHKLLLCAMLGGTPACLLVVPTAASASPIDYALAGTTATFGTAGTDTLTGTFTFDASGPTLNAVDIAVTGPIEPGTYDMIPTQVSDSAIQARNPGQFITLGFASPLTGGIDPLIQVIFATPFGSVGPFSSAVTGEAVPTPEPAPLPVLGGACGLFLLTRRRCRRSRQIGAFAGTARHSARRCGKVSGTPECLPAPAAIARKS